MWEKIKGWFMSIGEFMFQFLKTAISDTVADIGPTVLDIVRQVEAECEGGCSGQEKFDKALALAVMKLPEIAINAIRIAIEVAVAIMNENADDDKDGVLNKNDKCPTEGDTGCGVTLDGCTIPCSK